MLFRKIRKKLGKFKSKRFKVETLHEKRKEHWKQMLHFDRARNRELAAYHRGAKDALEWALKAE